MTVRRSARGVRLIHKVVLALLLIFALLVIALSKVLGPATGDKLRERSDALVASSADAMRDMLAAQTAEGGDLLVRLIEEITESRRRVLEDLPLELFDGDVVRVREALRDRDAARGEVLRRNVAHLVDEIGRRNHETVDEQVRHLVAAQNRLAADIVGDLQPWFLGLALTMLAIALLGFGLGLHRLVVVPVRRLAGAADAIARGDLTVDVEAPPRGDEVADLGRGFRHMVGELRAARDEIAAKNRELETWNATLADEVARKTGHLEQSLNELKRTQHRLVQAAKMSSLGTLAGGVAHEFNNLIGGISGCAREALRDETDPERRETLEIILRATDRGAEVTDRLLRFARQRVATSDDVDVAQVLREAVSLIESRARRGGIEVRTDVPESIAMRADSSALHQVFLNLLTNAVQAMPTGGRIDVVARREHDHVVVKVIDRGVGIPKEHREHVFDPFWSSKSDALDPERRGSGLGLSVSHGLVEAHGGALEFESELGVGTTFIVRLPVEQPQSR
ncbi:MAG: sensor histidine kinase [Planctomycetota bacterium]